MNTKKNNQLYLDPVIASKLNFTTQRSDRVVIVRAATLEKANWITEVGKNKTLLGHYVFFGVSRVVCDLVITAQQQAAEPESMPRKQHDRDDQQHRVVSAEGRNT